MDTKEICKRTFKYIMIAFVIAMAGTFDEGMKNDSSLS